MAFNIYIFLSSRIRSLLVSVTAKTYFTKYQRKLNLSILRCSGVCLPLPDGTTMQVTVPPVRRQQSKGKNHTATSRVNSLSQEKKIVFSLPQDNKKYRLFSSVSTNHIYNHIRSSLITSPPQLHMVLLSCICI